MKPPIFIVGCPRSGTSFLYHLLLSAGGFAEFHTQMNVFDVLEPIFGDLRVPSKRKAMMEEWLRSKAFAVSGLDAGEIEANVMAECRCGSDFLRIVMEEIAARQGADGWIDSTPTNIPHMKRIARDFPDARFIHIIRDGRDVALSLDKRGWSRPLPWDRPRSLLAAGLYWEWIVRIGRESGRSLGTRYIEVRYEELVADPKPVLARIADFLGRELDCDRILRTKVGSVQTPLTAFQDDLKQGHFSPVGRWREKFPTALLVRFEQLVGRHLEELGYPLAHSIVGAEKTFSTRAMRWEYFTFYDWKQWAKIHTPLSRWMVSYSGILIDK